MGFPAASGTIASRQLTNEFSPEITRAIDADTLRSVYVEASLVLPVVQQPSGKPNYVSTNNGEVTQFSAALKHGNIGLLAHNYLSGKSFSRLAIGDEVRVEFGDGKIESFIITEILHYQALEPSSPYSSFQNVDNKDEVLSAGQMFERVYAGDYHLTFQTCIKANGNSSWGRLFIVATPESEYRSVASVNVP